MSNVGTYWAPAGAGTGDGSSAANAGSSALAIKQRTGTTTNGLYWVKAPNGTAQQVYCDMNLDGGGWMLIARTTSNGTGELPGQFGWKATAVLGAPTTFNAVYCLDIGNWYNNGFRWRDFAFGNQYDNVSNNWGPFVYAVSIADVDYFMNNDVQWTGSNYRTLKSDTNVYGSTAFPGMQNAIGFPTTGTSNGVFYLRDCCGYAGYGIHPWGVQTTYCNSSSVPWASGPWCQNPTLSGNVYVQGGSSSVTNMGGVNQALLMVR